MYSDESAQEPFRCGMGNLFMCYQELIQYPTPCYTEQISNASGVEISVSDTLSLSFRREREKKNSADLDCSQKSPLVCCRKEHVSLRS